jgi:hypothetical protein
MRVLFDNGTPRGVAGALKEHVVEEARALGWDTLRNGELLDAAEAVGFDVFVTTDRNLRYQQNLTGRKDRDYRLQQSPMAIDQEQAPDDRGCGRFSDAGQLCRSRDSDWLSTPGGRGFQRRTGARL